MSIDIRAKSQLGEPEESFVARVTRSFLGKEHKLNQIRINVEEFISKKQRLAEWDD